jgi:hypothetical protein
MYVQQRRWYCVKIFDVSENEIAQVSPMTELFIKENMTPS